MRNQSRLVLLFLLLSYGCNSGSDEKLTIQEPVSAEKLMSFLPESLENRPKLKFDPKRASQGMGLSTAQAKYKGSAKGEIKIVISDQANLSSDGQNHLATLASMQMESENSEGYSKSVRFKSYPAHERMTTNPKFALPTEGSLMVIVADRFTVSGTGRDVEMKDLYAALEKIDLDKLATMKNEGARKTIESPIEGDPSALLESIKAKGMDIEPVKESKLQALLPKKLGPDEEVEIRSETSGEDALKTSSVSADYIGSPYQITIEIMDGAGFMRAYGAEAFSKYPVDRRKSNGFEKTTTIGTYPAKEEFSGDEDGIGHGSIELIIAKRFSVKVTGMRVSYSQLKSALDSIPLSKLEAMKDEGVLAYSFSQIRNQPFLDLVNAHFFTSRIIFELIRANSSYCEVMRIGMGKIQTRNTCRGLHGTTFSQSDS